ncbi:tetratricopeptide repeat protein [Methylopila sp. M107]|uniref:tetratricopeptide repeat protein n=1 Tax=Methylopila sp. M107 TaxID=1101190 RepID=UPI00035F3A05|nr:tetratricopeptide repeat protein [Methylopila sp. M107]
MADIFQEVQEDLRRDRLKAFWDRYGTLLLVVGLLIVAGVGGWRGYQYLQARAAATAGDQYQAATKLSTEGKADEARAAFGEIGSKGPTGYQTVARLREADEAAKKDKAAALKLYQAIANDPAADPLLKDAARIRGAYVAVDAGKPEDVRALVEPIAAKDGAWRSLAREALGLAAFKAGDMAEARRQLEAVVSDPEAVGNVRQRADLMLAVLPPAAQPAPADKPTN